MEELAGALAILAVASVSVGLWILALRAELDAWRTTARKLGMSEASAWLELPSTRRLAGELDGFPVTMRSLTRRSSRGETRVEVDGCGRIPHRIELRAEGLQAGLEKAFRGADVETGDPDFDCNVLAWGHPVLLSALLDAETRRRIRRLVEDGGRVRHGTVVTLVGREVSDPDRLVLLVQEAVAIAKRLVDPGDLAARLAANAAADPLGEVRLRNLERLVERFPARPETGAALRTALEDNDLRVRVWAAARLGDEGREVLLAHARAAVLDDEVVVTAVGGLGSALPVEHALDLLDASRVEGRVVLESAVIDALGCLGDPRARARLIAILGEDDGRWSVPAAARALAAAGDPAVEPHLVAALGRDDDTLRAAVEGLGRLGSVAAVAPLREAAAARPLDRPLRHAVAAAIAAIQERATGAAPGQLALAGGAAGALSLAGDGGAGRVALAGSGAPSRSAGPGPGRRRGEGGHA